MSIITWNKSIILIIDLDHKIVNIDYYDLMVSLTHGTFQEYVSLEILLHWSVYFEWLCQEGSFCSNPKPKDLTLHLAALELSYFLNSTHVSLTWVYTVNLCSHVDEELLDTIATLSGMLSHVARVLSCSRCCASGTSFSIIAEHSFDP